LELELDNFGVDLSLLTARVNVLEADYADINSEVSDLQVDVLALQSDVSTLQTNLNTLSSELTTVTQQHYITLCQCYSGGTVDGNVQYFLSGQAFDFYGGTPITIPPSWICPINCTGKWVSYSIYARCSNNCSSQAATVFLRKNDTTNYTLNNAVVLTGSGPNSFQGAGDVQSSNYTFGAGDYYHVGFTSPTWTTNPINMRITVTACFQLDV